MMSGTASAEEQAMMRQAVLQNLVLFSVVVGVIRIGVLFAFYAIAKDLPPILLLLLFVRVSNYSFIYFPQVCSFYFHF